MKKVMVMSFLIASTCLADGKHIEIKHEDGRSIYLDITAFATGQDLKEYLCNLCPVGFANGLDKIVIKINGLTELTNQADLSKLVVGAYTVFYTLTQKNNAPAKP